MKHQPERVDRHAVYRAYDADRNLLYVGTTGKGIARVGEHTITAEWWPSVRFLIVEHAQDREHARIIETDAIERENPRYNRARRPGWNPDEVARLVAEADSLTKPESVVG